MYQSAEARIQFKDDEAYEMFAFQWEQRCGYELGACDYAIRSGVHVFHGDDADRAADIGGEVSGVIVVEYMPETGEVEQCGS